MDDFEIFLSLILFLVREGSQIYLNVKSAVAVRKGHPRKDFSEKGNLPDNVFSVQFG